MVQLTTRIFGKIRQSTRQYLKQSFRDNLRVYVQGGAGGNGYPKFGGVGGKGGDVIGVAKENYNLEDVYKANKSKRYMAKGGRHSTHNFILGTPGEDLKFDLPVGVIVVTDMGKKLGELNEVGEELVLAKGGTGGHEKNGFLGTKGQAYPVRLDLKLIADIGLVGFPNAGKSTILKAVSHAKPKVASYPFTTIKPNVGILQYKDHRHISMADLPGLIEGAHINKGMGHEFLKHVERTKMILFVVDINGFQLSPQYPHRTCLENVILLIKELELYNKDLLAKPVMLVVNKMDTEGALDKYNAVKGQLKNLQSILSDFPEEVRPETPVKFYEIIPMSARDSLENVDYLKQRLRDMLDVIAEQQKENEPEIEDLKHLKEKGPVKI
ncbi:unnamed protein product [Phyllotreta striolata]|uniref:GTP-binding protein 10 homolog n=1 Tax=Phyllotreta striolata TaxID=444603 RepID=A0A9N9U004_PHYSR|nr:unnamed protein product [Phyllotreta striolata]